MEVTDSDKSSILLHYGIYYSCKMPYSTGHRKIIVAYYNAEFIMAVKCFIVQATGN